MTKDTALLQQRHTLLSGYLQVSTMPTFLFNNTGDAAVLDDHRSVRMDSVHFSPTWGGSTGTSLERIDHLGDPNDSTNWSVSSDSLFGTPARANSIVLLDHDLALYRIGEAAAPPGQNLTFFATVRNAGRFASSPFTLRFYHDRNRDSIPEAGELVATVAATSPLQRRDTIQVNAAWVSAPPGVHSMIARLEYQADLRLSNNSALFQARIGYTKGSIVINEIMYEPFAQNAEYVELINVRDTVDVAGWSLSDAPGGSGAANTFPISQTSRIIAPGEFLVIASDSSFFLRFTDTLLSRHTVVVNRSNLNLNNEGDAVVIRDAAGFPLDSVRFAPGWHSPRITDASGRSLERIHPLLDGDDSRSWSSCVFTLGGTPGRTNSIHAERIPVAARISSQPSPFSPDGDGTEDFTVIQYELPVEAASVSLRIFDVKGRMIRHLMNNEPGGSSGSVVWDGFDNEKQKARVGIYILLLEAVNATGAEVFSTKGIVVLAAKL
jgi:hypothetical protein